MANVMFSSCLCILHLWPGLSCHPHRPWFMLTNLPTEGTHHPPLILCSVDQSMVCVKCYEQIVLYAWSKNYPVAGNDARFISGLHNYWCINPDCIFPDFMKVKLSSGRLWLTCHTLITPHMVVLDFLLLNMTEASSQIKYLSQSHKTGVTVETRQHSNKNVEFMFDVIILFV